MDVDTGCAAHSVSGLPPISVFLGWWGCYIFDKNIRYATAHIHRFILYAKFELSIISWYNIPMQTRKRLHT